MQNAFVVHSYRFSYALKIHDYLASFPTATVAFVPSIIYMYNLFICCFFPPAYSTLYSSHIHTINRRTRIEDNEQKQKMRFVRELKANIISCCHNVCYMHNMAFMHFHVVYAYAVCTRPSRFMRFVR